ncbi:hypothetical protein AB0B31_11055 [Catellatospora citrea]|uniref:hypothetical protein n=1 Tax=Catellatospora citrea TaxID=53366 RepID=UPI0033E62CAA
MSDSRITVAAQAFGIHLADLPWTPADPYVDLCADIITRFPTHRTARAVAGDVLHGGGLHGSGADLHGITDHAYSVIMRWLNLHLPAKATWRPALVALNYASPVMYPAQADTSELGDPLAVRFTPTVIATIAADLPHTMPGWHLTAEQAGAWTLSDPDGERVTYGPDPDGMLRIGSGLLPWTVDDGAIHRRVAVSMRPLRNTELPEQLLYYLYLHELPQVAAHLAAEKIHHWAGQFTPAEAAELLEILDLPDTAMVMRRLPRPAPHTVTETAAQLWELIAETVPGAARLTQLQADDALTVLWMLVRHQLINQARRVLTGILATPPGQR